MATERVYFLLRVAAVFFVTIVVSASDHDGGTLKLREERAAVAVNCAAQNFVPLDTCGCALVPLVSSAAVLSCAGGLKRVDLFSMVKSYVINGAQSSTNKIDFSSTAMQNAFGDRICYTECVFTTQKFLLADKSLNIPAITASFLASGITAAQTPIVQAAITKCATKTAIVTSASITTVLGKVCQLKPAIFFQCIREQMLLTCPTKKASTICTPLYASLLACDPFI